MDVGEIIGTALLAFAAIGCAVVISVGLTLAIRRFVSKTFSKRRV